MYVDMGAITVLRGSHRRCLYLAAEVLPRFIVSRDGMTSIKLGKFRAVRSEKNRLLSEQVVIQVRNMIRRRPTGF